MADDSAPKFSPTILEKIKILALKCCSEFNCADVELRPSHLAMYQAVQADEDNQSEIDDDDCDEDLRKVTKKGTSASVIIGLPFFLQPLTILF